MPASPPRPRYIYAAPAGVLGTATTIMQYLDNSPNWVLSCLFTVLIFAIALLSYVKERHKQNKGAANDGQPPLGKIE
jgi:hypothetical protein